MSLIKKILSITIILFFASLSKVFAEDLKKVGKFKDWETIVVTVGEKKLCFA